MNDGMDNQAMFWKLPTINAFHSIVPGSVMEFYESVGVPRSVGSPAGGLPLCSAQPAVHPLAVRLRQQRQHAICQKRG